ALFNTETRRTRRKTQRKWILSVLPPFSQCLRVEKEAPSRRVIHPHPTPKYPRPLQHHDRQPFEIHLPRLLYSTRRHGEHGKKHGGSGCSPCFLRSLSVSVLKKEALSR